MKYVRLIICLAILGSFVACKDNDVPKIKVENEVHSFIWGAMNQWYFWQDDVADLSDSRFKSDNQRNEFLNTFSNPTDLFQSLRFSGDRFSWIVEDYDELNNAFQGISKSFGYDFGLVYLSEGGKEIIGYVQYVLPGSPAEQAGLIRGDVFYAVDGITLDDENFRTLLFGKESYVLSKARLEERVLIPTMDTPVIVAVQLTENPVFMTKVVEAAGRKIGYIVYNSFTHTFHSQLNDAFGELKAEGVTEIVLDLRYNSGGSIYTAMHLAGMVYGEATNNSIFGKIVYNEKQSKRNLDLPFLVSVDVLNGDFQTVRTETMNRLNVSKLYILTGNNTASASELLIAGLRAYMPVVLIGSKTVGKNEGSLTLYDAPKADYRDRQQANPNHKWALQPIVTKLANSLNFSDFDGGFDPDVELREHRFLETMLPLGDPDELLLKAAIDDITGAGSTGRQSGVNRGIISFEKNKYQLNTGMLLNGLDY